VYHPLPYNSKEKREMIFLALLRQHGQEMVSVPMGTSRSVTVPENIQIRKPASLTPWVGELFKSDHA
jgi:hypothetical protein